MEKDRKIFNFAIPNSYNDENFKNVFKYYPDFISRLYFKYDLQISLIFDSFDNGYFLSILNHEGRQVLKNFINKLIFFNVIEMYIQYFSSSELKHAERDHMASPLDEPSGIFRRTFYNFLKSKNVNLNDDQEVFIDNIENKFIMRMRISIENFLGCDMRNLTTSSKITIMKGVPQGVIRIFSLKQYVKPMNYQSSHGNELSDIIKKNTHVLTTMINESNYKAVNEMFMGSLNEDFKSSLKLIKNDISKTIRILKHIEHIEDGDITRDAITTSFHSLIIDSLNNTGTYDVKDKILSYLNANVDPLINSVVSFTCSKIISSHNISSVFDELTCLKGIIGEYVLCQENSCNFNLSEEEKKDTQWLIKDLSDEIIGGLPTVNYLCPDGLTWIAEGDDIIVTVHEFGWVSNMEWKKKCDIKKWERFIKDLEGEYESLLGKCQIKVKLNVQVVNNRSILELNVVRSNQNLCNLITGIIESLRTITMKLGVLTSEKFASIVYSPILGNFNENRMRILDPPKNLLVKLSNDVSSDIYNDFLTKIPKQDLDFIGIKSKDQIFINADFNSETEKLRLARGMSFDHYNYAVDYTCRNFEDVSESRWQQVDETLKMKWWREFNLSFLNEELIYKLLISGRHNISDTLFEFNHNYPDDLIERRFKGVSHSLEHFNEKRDKKTKHYCSAAIQIKLGFKYWVSSNSLYGESASFKKTEHWWKKFTSNDKVESCSLCQELIFKVSNCKTKNCGCIVCYNRSDNQLDELISNLCLQVKHSKDMSRIFDNKVYEDCSHPNGDIQITKDSDIYVSCVNCGKTHASMHQDMEIKQLSKTLISEVGKCIEDLESFDDRLNWWFILIKKSAKAILGMTKNNDIFKLLIRRFLINLDSIIMKFSDLQSDLKPQINEEIKSSSIEFVDNFLELLKRQNESGPSFNELNNKLKNFIKSEEGSLSVLSSDVCLKILKCKSDTFRMGYSKGFIVSHKHFGLIHVDKALLSEESVFYQQLSGLAGFFNHRILRTSDAAFMMNLSNSIIEDQMRSTEYRMPYKNIKPFEYSKWLNLFIKENSRRLNVMTQNLRYLCMASWSELACLNLGGKLNSHVVKWSELLLTMKMCEFMSDICTSKKEVRCIFEVDQKCFRDDKPLLIHQFYKLHYFDKSISGASQEMWKIYMKFLKPKIKLEELTNMTEILSADGECDTFENFLDLCKMNFCTEKISTPTFNHYLIQDSMKHYDKIIVNDFQGEVHDPKPISDLCKTSSTINNYKEYRNPVELYNNYDTKRNCLDMLKVKGCDIANELLKKVIKGKTVKDDLMNNVLLSSSKPIVNDKSLIAADLVMFNEENKIILSSVKDKALTKDTLSVFLKILIKLTQSLVYQYFFRKIKLEQRKRNMSDILEIEKSYNKILDEDEIGDVSLFRNKNLSKVMYLIMTGLDESFILSCFEEDDTVSTAIEKALTKLIILEEDHPANYIVSSMIFNSGIANNSIKSQIQGLTNISKNSRAITTDLIVKFIQTHPELEYSTSLDCIDNVGLNNSPIFFGMAHKEQFGGERELTLSDLEGKLTLKTVEDMARAISRCATNSCLNNPGNEEEHKKLTASFQLGNEQMVRDEFMISKFNTNMKDVNLSTEHSSDSKRTVSIVMSSSEDHSKWGPFHNSSSFLSVILRLDLTDDIKNIFRYGYLKHQKKLNEIPSSVIEKVMNKTIRNDHITQSINKDRMIFKSQDYRKQYSKEELYILDKVMNGKMVTHHRIDMGQGMIHSGSDVYGSFANCISDKMTKEVFSRLFDINVHIINMNTSDDSNSIIFFDYKRKSNLDEMKVMRNIMNIRDFCQRMFNLHLSVKSTCSSTISEFKSTFIHQGEEVKALIKFASSQLMIGRDFAPQHFWESYYSLAKQALNNGASQVVCDLLGLSKYRLLRKAYPINSCCPFGKEFDHVIPPSMGGFHLLTTPQLYWGAMNCSILVQIEELNEEISRSIQSGGINLIISDDLKEIKLTKDKRILHQDISIQLEERLSNDIMLLKESDLLSFINQVLVNFFSMEHLHPSPESDELCMFKRLSYITPRSMKNLLNFKSEVTDCNLNSIRSSVLVNYQKRSAESLKIISHQALMSAKKNSFKNSSQSAVYQKGYHLSKGKFFRNNDSDRDETINMMECIINNKSRVDLSQSNLNVIKSNFCTTYHIAKNSKYSKIEFLSQSEIKLYRNLYHHESSRIEKIGDKLINDPLIVLTSLKDTDSLSLIPRNKINYSNLEDDKSQFLLLNLPQDPVKLGVMKENEEGHTVEGSYCFPKPNDPVSSIETILNHSSHPYLKTNVNIIKSDFMIKRRGGYLHDLTVTLNMISTLDIGEDLKREMFADFLISRSDIKAYCINNYQVDTEESLFLNSVMLYSNVISDSSIIRSHLSKISRFQKEKTSDGYIITMMFDGNYFRYERNDQFSVCYCSNLNDELNVNKIKMFCSLLRLNFPHEIRKEKLLMKNINLESGEGEFEIQITLKSGSFLIRKILKEGSMKVKSRELWKLSRKFLKAGYDLGNDITGNPMSESFHLEIKSPSRISLSELWFLVKTNEFSNLFTRIRTHEISPNLSNFEVLKHIHLTLSQSSSWIDKESSLKKLLKEKRISSRMKEVVKDAIHGISKGFMDIFSLFSDSNCVNIQLNKGEYDSNIIAMLISMMRRVESLDQLSKLKSWVTNIIPMYIETGKIPDLNLGTMKICRISSSKLFQRDVLNIYNIYDQEFMTEMEENLNQIKTTSDADTNAIRVSMIFDKNVAITSLSKYALMNFRTSILMIYKHDQKSGEYKYVSEISIDKTEEALKQIKDLNKSASMTSYHSALSIQYAEFDSARMSIM